MKIQQLKDEARKEKMMQELKTHYLFQSLKAVIMYEFPNNKGREIMKGIIYAFEDCYNNLTDSLITKAYEEGRQEMKKKLLNEEPFCPICNKPIDEEELKLYTAHRKCL